MFPGAPSQPSHPRHDEGPGGSPGLVQDRVTCNSLCYGPRMRGELDIVIVPRKGRQFAPDMGDKVLLSGPDGVAQWVTQV